MRLHGNYCFLMCRTKGAYIYRIITDPCLITDAATDEQYNT